MSAAVPIPKQVERRVLAGLCIALAFLQLLDLHSSLHAAKMGRGETNPLILWAIGRIGFTHAIVAFKAASLAVLGIYYRVVRRFEQLLLPTLTLLPVCSAYVGVVLHNYW